MKITIEADCHLNKAIYKGVLDKKYTALPFRTVDFMKAHLYIVNENIKKIKPDLMVIAGDTFDTYDPSNEVRAFSNRQLKKLVDAGIEVIILVGNHDVCKKHHALSPIKSLEIDGINVIEEPTLKVVGDKLLMLFPYSLKVERGEIGIKDQFNQFVQETHDKIEADESLQNKEIIFFGHFGVKGAVLKQYTLVSEEKASTNTTTTKSKALKNYLNSSAEDISFADLDKIGADYIFLGDYHQHQILQNEVGFAMYGGSIERTDMSEHDQDKGYLVYDDGNVEDPTTGKARFMKYPKCRPMIEFRGNAFDMIKEIDSLPTKGVKGAIVKISFVGSSKELLDFASNLDEIKKKIKVKINPVHMYNQQKVIDEESEEEAHILEDEILSKGHIDEELVHAAVKEMIIEKEKDEVEQAILIDIAVDIYKETMEG